jgi:tetratricopeptide (TPR) repeat protein
MEEADAPYEQAIRAFDEGDVSTAISIVKTAARAAKKDFGGDSVQYAAALFAHANILVRIGKYSDAISMARKAYDTPAVDGPSAELRLTYNDSLGEWLQANGEDAAAERQLREGLAQRAALYGTSSAGYAFGLRALSSALLAREKTSEAAALSGEAFRILLAEKHPRAYEFWLSHAMASVADGALDAALAALAPDAVDAAATEVLLRFAEHPLGSALALLDAFASKFAGAAGEPPAWLSPLLIAQSNLARISGAHGARVAALEALVACHDRRREAGAAFEAQKGVALAHAEHGDLAEAEGAYRDCMARAESLGEVQRRASAERDFGIFLDASGRGAEARAMLRSSVDHARVSGDELLVGRALTALAISHQHGGALTEAAPLFAEAIDRLPLMHADAICARSHQHATIVDGKCGCGDMDRAVSEALGEGVRRAFSEISLDSVTYRSGRDGSRVSLAFLLEPPESVRVLVEARVLELLREFQSSILAAT